MKHYFALSLLQKTYFTGRIHVGQVEFLRYSLLGIRHCHSFRNEVDIKGHDGVIYKGRIEVEKLPAVDSHKKSSMGLLAPPLPKSRLDVHPIPPIQSQQQGRETTVIDSERSDGSPMFPNLQPALPREESFT